MSTAAAQQNSPWPSGKYQRPDPSHTCPSGSPGRGPTPGKKVQATSTQRDRHRRRGYHILPRFPASSTSSAKQRGQDKVPGRHGRAAPARPPRSSDSRADARIPPGHLKGEHVCTSAASCYPSLFPADTALGGRQRWLSPVWERNEAGERQ